MVIMEWDKMWVCNRKVGVATWSGIRCGRGHRGVGCGKVCVVIVEWDKMWAWSSWSGIRCGRATGRWVWSPGVG